MSSTTENMMRHFANQAEHRRFDSVWDRRQFLATMGLGGIFYTVPGSFAQALVPDAGTDDWPILSGPAASRSGQ